MGGVECEKCRVGFYKVTSGRQACDRCPDSTTTEDTGTSSELDCLGEHSIDIRNTEEAV